MAGFWDKLKKPFMVLAPMDDVTDTVFRQVVAGVGRPDVFFTEFTNVDAINYAVSGSNPQSRMLDSHVATWGPAARARFVSSAPQLYRLLFSECERPIVAQIWGTEPEKFLRAAQVIKSLKFDGIDINFGCPERKAVKAGACGAMIGNFDLVKEIVAATREGARGLPVSVKTRIGNKNIMTEEWVSFLLEQNLAAITIHGRTVAEESKVPAHWEEIGKAVSLRNQFKSRTLIVGNGDVKSLAEAKEKATQFGVDGVMIGRGIFNNPGFFADKTLMPNEKRELFKQHIRMFRETWGEKKNFEILKKFMKLYVNGYPGATELRTRLAKTRTISGLEKELE